MSAAKKPKQPIRCPHRPTHGGCLYPKCPATCAGRKPSREADVTDITEEELSAAMAMVLGDIKDDRTKELVKSGYRLLILALNRVRYTIPPDLDEFATARTVASE